MMFLLTLFLSFASSAVPSGLPSIRLTPQEERGLQIYLTGLSPAGSPIIAYFGKDLLEVPGESATCVSCHGHDGFGRAESGVLPSNITWDHLMKSYGHIHPGGVEHSAFTVQSLKTYMQDGVYPGGMQGDPSMPVYEISEPDLDDLIAYNRRLGSYLDPGLTDKSIRIGMVLQKGGTAGELGEVMRRTVQAAFSDINGRGGIYGRMLELVAVHAAGGAESPAKLRELLEQSRLFALVNSFTPGQEQGLEALAEELQIPQVAPFTAFSAEIGEFRRYTFHLHAGLREQVRALAIAAARNRQLADPRIVIFYPRRDRMEEVADAAEAEFQEKGWRRIIRLAHDPGGFDARAAMQRLQKERADLVLLIGGESEAEAFFGEPAQLSPLPIVYMPGSGLGKTLFLVPGAYKDRIFLSFPALPGDRKGWGTTEFDGMAGRQGLSISHPTVQITSFAAAKLLAEGLRRAGRDLSRERLVESMETLFEYDTGLTRPVSFGKNRRTGTFGAHVVSVDPERRETSDYLVPVGWTGLK
jgi:ABC-type branched-subunit amino acid transport system substrate-binding protein